MDALLLPIISMVALAVSFLTARKGARRSSGMLPLLLWLPLAYIAGVACALGALAALAPALGVPADSSDASPFMRSMLMAVALPFAGALVGAVKGRERRQDQ